jgi:glycosyltransferase involved in cell wall biosynthesis
VSEVRPIIVAENASAAFGGEAILPLHYFRLLRKRGVETWLVTHERIQRELSARDDLEHDRIFYVADRPFHRRTAELIYRYPSKLLEVPAGMAMRTVTQGDQRRLLRELIPRLGANLVHEPTPVSPKAPSAIYDLGVPVVIGPMNGGMTYPPGFPGYESGLERRFVHAARAVAWLGHMLLPGKRRAAALLVANQRTREALPSGTCPHVFELPENGVDFSLFEAHVRRVATSGPLRVVFLGRLVDWKGVDLLLQACARARECVPLELLVIGDGVERARLEALTRELSLDDIVRFAGFVPQHACPELLQQSDVLVLPSVYECGGAVVLEAMAMGLPVIATRWGGPAEYLDESSGILLEPLAPAPFVAALSDALVRLARAPALRLELGERGRTRVQKHFDWERKIDRMLEIYRHALGEQRAPNEPRIDRPTQPEAAAVAEARLSFV